MANLLPRSHLVHQIAWEMDSLMYFGVKNTRLRSLTAAQLTLPLALGGSTNPPFGLGWLN